MLDVQNVWEQTDIFDKRASKWGTAERLKLAIITAIYKILAVNWL
jgi:hypothetical protein